MNLTDLLNVSQEEADKSFEKLAKQEPKNDYSRIGNHVLKKYFLKYILEIKTKKGISFLEALKNKHVFERLKRKAKEQKKKMDIKTLYYLFSLYYGSVSSFRPSYAKFIYDTFKPKTVLDFSAGFGGRLLGALAYGCNYIGIEPNIDLKQSYKTIINRYNIHNVNVKMIWDYAENVNFKHFKYDMIFTSPPYEYIQKYKYMKNYKSFYDDFLVPVIFNAFKYLQDGGVMALNLNDKLYSTLINKYKLKAADKKIIYPVHSRTINKKKYGEYVYIWFK